MYAIVLLLSMTAGDVSKTAPMSPAPAVAVPAAGCAGLAASGCSGFGRNRERHVFVARGGSGCSGGGRSFHLLGHFRHRRGGCGG